MQVLGLEAREEDTLWFVGDEEGDLDFFFLGGWGWGGGRVEGRGEGAYRYGICW